MNHLDCGRKGNRFYDTIIKVLISIILTGDLRHRHTGKRIGDNDVLSAPSISRDNGMVFHKLIFPIAFR